MMINTPTIRRCCPDWQTHPPGECPHSTKTLLDMIESIQAVQRDMAALNQMQIRSQYRSAYGLAFDHLTIAQLLLTAIKDATKD